MTAERTVEAHLNTGNCALAALEVEVNPH